METGQVYVACLVQHETAVQWLLDLNCVCLYILCMEENMGEKSLCLLWLIILPRSKAYRRSQISLKTAKHCLPLKFCCALMQLTTLGFAVTTDH